MAPSNEHLADALRELMELLYVHGGALPYNAVINIRKRLEPPCPTTNDSATPSPIASATTPNALAETTKPSPLNAHQSSADPSPWPLPPRPEKSAARTLIQQLCSACPPGRPNPQCHICGPRGGEHGGDSKSGAQSAGDQSGGSAADAGVSTTATTGEKSVAQTIPAPSSEKSVSSATSSAPAADPVGVPEWCIDGAVQVVRTVVLPRSGNVGRVISCDDTEEAAQLTDTINSGLFALRQHHERVVAGLAKERDEARSSRDAAIARGELVRVERTTP